MEHTPSLVVPRPVWQRLLAHLTDCLPEEGVGYLLGPPGPHATSYFPLENELHSPTAFRTSATSALAAHKEMRATGTELLAVVHSHPTTPPVPSRHDRAENPFGAAIPWLIVGLDPPATARLWRLGDEVEELGWMSEDADRPADPTHNDQSQGRTPE